MVNSNPISFGALLLYFRAAAGLTQEQPAERAGISPAPIAALERGRRQTPRQTTIELLATALGLDERDREQMLATVRTSVAPPHVSSAVRVDGSTARRLCNQPTPLVGRSQEIDTILRLLAEDGVRLLTLTGPAGVGKTRLALAAVTHFVDVPNSFPDGVIFVDLTSVRDPALVLNTIARSLGLLDVGSRPALERLQDALAERQQLIVLDNFEQVLPSAAQIAELLASCSGLALLVTSRVALQLRWEQTLRIAPLPVPDLSRSLPPLRELVTIPSIALFVQWVRARQADFVLTEKQAPLVARLVAQLDGLPLALELAAARTATLSLPVIAHRLGDRLRLLRWEAADLPEQHRSLEAAVGWSYDLLSEGEQHLFRYLGVFVGRVTLDAITAVVAAVCPKAQSMESHRMVEDRVMQGLLALAEQHLILPARPTDLGWQHEGTEDANDEMDNEPEFGMLDTVREYAAEQLAAVGELEAAQRAHASYFLALAERAIPELRGRDQRTWFFRLEREHDNLRAALRWLLDQDNPCERERALRLASALGSFWSYRGYHAVGRRWLEEVLDRAPQGEREEEDPTAAWGPIISESNTTRYPLL